MRFTAQLVQTLHLRMISAEIAEEVAGSPAVVTGSATRERVPNFKLSLFLSKITRI